MVSKTIFNLNYQIMEKEPVRVLALFLCNGTKNTGNHIEKEGTFYFFCFFKFFNHIIIINLNNKIMEKEPVRVLTPFQCDGTKKHWEPHRERGYHLKILFSFFFSFPPPFFFFFCNKVIIF